MGSYLNPGNKGFRESLNSQIYVDKSGLIEQTNAVLDTREKYVCVSRPRRFGKSMTIDMMTAYYDRNCESETLFSSLEISQKDSYQKYRSASLLPPILGCTTPGFSVHRSRLPTFHSHHTTLWSLQSSSHTDRTVLSPPTL